MNFANFRRALAMLLIMAVVFTVLPPVSASAADADWSLSDDTGIFLVKNADTEKDFDALAAQVRLFSTELAEKVTGTPLEIVYGEEDQAGAHDIILELDSNLELDIDEGVKEQGYEVDIEDGAVVISAIDAEGLFYGCRYLIKQLMLNDSVASASDAPWVGERAVSLDNGRKYFSVDWIKELIREMSWAEMNALVLHFSEDMGLGIESKLYPWLAGRDGTLCTQAEVTVENTYLTQEEVVEIVEYAKLYHIEIIPSLDSPGHMNYIVKKFNEKCATQDYSFTYDGKTYTAEAGSEIGNYYHYNGQTTLVKGSRNAAYSRGIDISNEVAVTFTKSLLTEYATLFAKLGCTKFDIGGDELLGWDSAIVSNVNKWQQLDHWKEYAQNRAKAEGKSNWASAVAYDGFLYYMNDLNDLVRKLGYTSVRMWNDDALRSSDTGWTGVVQLDTDIDIWFWTTGTNTYETYADAGYEIYNILGDYCYYAMTEDYFSDSRSNFAKAYADQIYDYWNPFEYDTESGDNRDHAKWEDTRVKGGAFGIWCDNPTLKTQTVVMTEVLPLIRANAAKCWYPTTDRVDYATFTANWEKFGSAPVGTVEAPEIYVIPDLTALEAAVAEFETVDGTLYTEESYAAYTETVEAGKALLSVEKPTQAQTDAAMAAIGKAKQALAEKPQADMTALNEAVSEFEAINAIEYTSESYTAYKNAVDAAKALLAQESYTQVEVDAAVAAINTAKEALVRAESSGVDCMISASFRTSRANAGKQATLAVAVEKGAPVVGIRLCDDRGNVITFRRQTKNTTKADRDVFTLVFSVTEADMGIRTYRAYAILADGSLSDDYVTATITIK